MNETAWGGKGHPNAGYWPQAFPYYNPAQDTAPDVAAAERELQGTKCENGCTLHYLVKSAAPWAQPAALLLQQQLEPLGIKLELESVDYATYLAREEKMQYEMTLDTWTGLVAEPESLTTINLQPSGPVKAAFTGYKSPKMDSLIEELLASPVAKRAPIAKQVEELFLEDMPFANVVDLFYVNAANVPESVLRQELLGLRVG